MTRFGLLGAAAAVAGVGGALLLLEVPRDEARADDPQPVARFKAHLRTFQTVYVDASYLVSAHPESTHNTWSYTFRWDAARGLGSIDGTASNRYAWFDGQASWDWDPEAPHVARGGHSAPPTFYGPAVDAAIAEAWAEVRAGLPNCTFALATDMPGLHSRMYEIHTPFSWASPYEILVHLEEDGTPDLFGVARRDTHQWVVGASEMRFGGKGKFEWDVPLRDDFADRDSPIPGDRNWHTEGGVHSTFDWLTAGTGEPPLWDPSRGPFPWTSVAWDTACVNGQILTKAVHLAFHWDSATAASGDRAVAAMAAGCKVGMSATTETRFTLAAKNEASFQGVATLRNQSGALLWSSSVNSALTAPADSEKSKWTPLERKVLLPTVDPPTALDLALDGTLVLECKATGPATNRVAVAMNDKGIPEIAWPGCFPELGILNTP